MSELNAVLVIAPVPIEAVMLGPGLHCWEFASELSRQQPVTLLPPNDSQLSHERFTMRSYAAQALAQLGRIDEGTTILLALARDSKMDHVIRSAAYESLKQLLTG